MQNAGRKFFECDPNLWDDLNDVGLRGHYICSVFGARLMVKKRSGLIVNISSGGGLQYFFNVPYGVGKAAVSFVIHFFILRKNYYLKLEQENIKVLFFSLIECQ